MEVKNAKQLPRVYFGLHFAEGVAEYREPGKDAYRICILENAAKAMDKTFAGKPVFVLHAEEDLDDILKDIQEKADGYVIESFFNQADGKHWAKFIVVSDKGHDAIRRGWTLSNAYKPELSGSGGQWHGVDYSKEVTGGQYDHLAIVPDPRYQESVIMTPEEFKAYNETKFADLKIANSKGDNMKLNFFKKTKVEKLENGTELESLAVKTKAGKEYTIPELVLEVEKIENMAGYANGDHMVKAGEEEMSVNALIEKYGAMCNEMAEMKKKENGEDDMDNADDEKKENGEDEADKDAKKDEKKENAEEDKKDEKKEEPKKNAHFNSLKSAPLKAMKAQETIIMTTKDKVALGKSRYGA